MIRSTGVLMVLANLVSLSAHADQSLVCKSSESSLVETLVIKPGQPGQDSERAAQVHREDQFDSGD